LRAADAPAAAPVTALAERLRTLGIDGVPLLVFRVPALERTAWRDGLRAARSLERRIDAAFASAVARVLRAGDGVAHDRGSDTFVAALVAPTRAGRSEVTPLDVRSALERIAATVAAQTGLEVDSGWTRFHAAAGSLGDAIVAALVRGAQERERYAFFSAVGHELRTPLASIRGYLETLLDDDIDLATRRRFVRIAYNESLRLGRLLEGMFEISLLDLSAPVSRHARAALDVVLAGVGDACAAAARSRDVALALPAIGPTPLAIDADRLMLVLINVIDNAIKHGRPGGRVDVGVELTHPRAVTVVVDDDGPGIPVTQRERIFALGERGDTRSGGSGIGLALVRMILERAGGRVEVVDAPCGGARFSVTIPRCAETGYDGNGGDATRALGRALCTVRSGE
jgi:signal transduction histidine kinase